MIPAILICTVAAITDADTIRCIDGTRVRLAGVSGLERNNVCNSRPDCPAMPYDRAKIVAGRIMQGRTYRMQVYGRSGKRLVADHPALRCQLIASGAVVEWRKYSRQYRLTPCGRRG